jgi:hypothetical protein
VVVEAGGFAGGDFAQGQVYYAVDLALVLDYVDYGQVNGFYQVVDLARALEGEVFGVHVPEVEVPQFELKVFLL